MFVEGTIPHADSQQLLHCSTIVKFNFDAIAVIKQCQHSQKCTTYLRETVSIAVLTRVIFYVYDM